MNPALRLARRIGFGHNELRRPVDRIAGLDAIIALLALWGGVELASGAVDFRLPTAWIELLGLHSWLLPGIALIAVIGVALRARHG